MNSLNENGDNNLESIEDMEIINGDKKPLEFYKINNISIGEIKNSFASKKQIPNLTIKESTNCLIVNKSLELYAIIFINPIEIIYESMKEDIKKKCDKTVYSTIQIDETIKTFGNVKTFFNLNNKMYSYSTNKINLVGVNNVTIFYSNNPFTFASNNSLLDPKKLTKDQLSMYFKEYFQYNDKDNKEEFYYYNSDEREKLSKNFDRLLFIDKVRKFKISGPSNDGKSTTLLYLSRLYTNIIYLNLKVLTNLYYKNEIKLVLNILMYEFGRIFFETKELKNGFEDKFNNNIEQTPWIIISNLIDYLIAQKIKVILILDQFKSSSVDAIFYENIEKKLSVNFKIIISFSISDNIDFNNIANSLEQNKGNPDELSEKVQDYYFYYSNLLNREEIKQLNKDSNKYQLYNLFDFHPKYIYLLNYHNELYIKNKIKNYLEGHCKEIGINNFNVYLFNYSKSIDKEFSFYNLHNITTKIPMKYSYLVFRKNNFIIRYQFKFLDSIINENLQLERVKEYFNENRDKNDYFEKKFKGDFF